jgi:hypothetical protein
MWINRSIKPRLSRAFFSPLFCNEPELRLGDIFGF